MTTAQKRTMSSITLLGLYVLLAAGADGQEVRYQRIGSSLTVTPDLSSVTPPITSLLWRHGSNKVLDWNHPDVTADDYGQFKGRATLNTITAEMTISNLTLSDSGIYSLDVDSSAGLLSPSLVDVRVIAPVPKPTVSTSCDDDMTSCTVSCDGNATNAGNITYSWRVDDAESEGARHVTLTKDAPAPPPRKYVCGMKNPVSVEWSESLCNPLISWLDCTGARMNMALAVFISLLAVVLVIIMVHRWKAGAWFYNTGYMPWEADFWRRHEEKEDSADVGVSATTGNQVMYRFTRRRDNDEAEANGSWTPGPEGDRLMTVNEGGASSK